MRKLRCTKQPGGCLRCTAEGVDCVFPFRRAMGRPKSHGPSALGQDDSELASLSNPERSSDFQKPSKLQDGPALHIMRLRSPPPGTRPTNPGPGDGQVPMNCQNAKPPSWTGFGAEASNLLTSINFGGQDSLQQSLRSESPPKTSSPKNPRAQEVTFGLGALFCCTERLLGCADSLSAMPNDFWGALRTARQSSRTVYEVLKCPQCGAASRGASEVPQADHSMGSVPSDPSPIAGILGAIVFPLISDAYVKVAELVNKEASTAVQGQIIFDLESCGGLWGPLGETSMRCQEYYSNLAINPELWRTTVRALLRTDLHGSDVQTPNDTGGTCLYHQPGLCDFIADIKDVLGRPNLDHGLKEPVKGLLMEPQSDSARISQVIELSQQSLDRLALALA